MAEARRTRLRANEATNAQEVAELAGVPINFDVNDLRARGIAAGSYDILIGPDGRGFRDTARSRAANGTLVPIEGNSDGVGTIITDDDGADAQMRRYTIDWVAPDGFEPITFIRTGEGPRVLFNPGRNETYGLSTSIGRFELSDAQRAQAEIGRQRVLAGRRADYNAWQAELGAQGRAAERAWTASIFRFYGQQIRDYAPVISDGFAINDFRRNPTWQNGVAAGVGFVPFVGDWAGRGIRAIPNIGGQLQTTGATRGIAEWDFDAAEDAYEAIRSSIDDVAAIARNTELPDFQIARIKRHLFEMSHQLDDGLRRFDAHPEIANAWRRMEAGTHSAGDIGLLRHEYFESRFEGIYRTDYRTAHEAANRAGYPSGVN